MVVGVLNRVEELADRPDNFIPNNAVPFKSLIPLQEIIADSLGVGVASKRVDNFYNNLIKNLGNELKILLDAKKNDLEKYGSEEIAEGIIRTREGKVNIEPGYDGVYGKIKIFDKRTETNIKLF